MSMVIENYQVTFSGVTYEDEIVPLRDYLQLSSPTSVLFDFSECDDIHLGILQLILAYKKLYNAEFLFGSYPKLYQRVCEGFELSETHCG
ncbi:MAG: hypothetical protein PHW18_03910 [Sulfuricurvum sp.]|uniref:hypothetical protein n=1 Tax=Sulfuricurvum sp. TaxID=2025608 RepID=UPI00260ACAB2|nr:hypothetical protein [Sulfuricurvum sp.]MDD2828698.1 hypothetical protein [Sulfuricurvum sp.]MDD4949276.1 hypothetical protein [Sulfuricurvum sp.]